MKLVLVLAALVLSVGCKSRCEKASERLLALECKAGASAQTDDCLEGKDLVLANLIYECESGGGSK